MKEKNYIGGKWVDNTLHFRSTNPSTGETLVWAPETSDEEVNQTVQIAKEAQKNWRKISRIARAEYFDKLCSVVKRRTNDLTNAISMETGKSLNESIAEVNESLHMAQYTFSQGRESFGRIVASEIAEKDISVFRKPKGVVAVISPWNFPLAIGGFWTSGPALLEGNTVVFKPSEETPRVGSLIAEMYDEAGFPPGVFNLVHGYGTTGAALVNADVDHICFTGSAEVGRYIRDKCNNSWKKSCSCEMGGKSAVIVFEDANINLAVNAAAASAFRLSGQRCVSAGRIMIQRSIFGEFVDRFVAETSKLTIGNPFNIPAPNLGPLINQSQIDKVVEYNEMTKHAEGVNVLLEGKQIDGAGYFITPHVYISEWINNKTHAFLREEVFGPHVALIPFDTIDDAVRIYNDTDYGLSISVCTTNMNIARHMRDNCDFGLGYVNLPCIGAESHCEFGGVKKSGYGGSSAAGSFTAVTHSVTWTTNYDASGFAMAQGLK